ncbi:MULTISPECIES: hypothetical protein [Priestia]|uniref:Uncharacterized protein n=1 Tax=Priestia megaterium TaxID=1404 RepID=A0ABD4WPP5_PRIMG|nr:MULTISPECIES: hypothetical protein [Priestia]MCF6798784.1 hypothetical protein [Bacillus sp. ET1]MCA4156903.1 hypothetical protein [Priestia megaterium]MCG0049627.1 hypothetical protein [Priestia aryabhattai]MDD9782191.1 hypothetical protein [Priestia megaterium]MED3924056.1 hypothetical protein [Priestia megaterium]
MIGGQGEDSCGEKRKRRGGSAPARGKRSLARTSRCHKRFIRATLSSLFVFRLDSFSYVSTSFLLLR